MPPQPLRPRVSPRRLRSLVLGGLLWLQALLASSQGQVTTTLVPDGTLGTAVTQRGTIYSITGGMRPGNGPNLFHSFAHFRVGTGDIARFSGPRGIENIISRATGGQPSTIDGVLRSEIAGANLFLLNPSGVLFGPNARLEVSGSFHVSTADVLRFADRATFAAHLGQDSVLTVAPPTAFGFLGNNPAAITIQGSTLRVPDGKAVSVVGGDIEIMGNAVLTSFGTPTLGARGGRINLASVASPGDVRFSPLELAPDLQVDGFARLGRIQLLQDALLDVSGSGGGSVLLRGEHLRVDGSDIFAFNTGPVDGTGLGLDLEVRADAVIVNDSLLTTDSEGAGRARDLRLTVGSLHLDNSIIRSMPFGSGDGGDLMVNVGDLRLTEGAEISSSSRGMGRGGRLIVIATEAITLSGDDSGLIANAFREGDAGSIAISTPRLTMEGGLIEATATEGSSGHAGNIDVRGGRFTLTGGAHITSGTRSVGHGGDLTVIATEAITLAGRNRVRHSGLFSSTFGPGDAGRLFVSTPLLTITGGAQIDSGTSTRGRGGDLTVIATEAITLAGRDIEGELIFESGLFSSTFGPGDAGRLFVSTPLLTITEGALIGSETQNMGRGGDIQVEATHLQLSNGGMILANSSGAGDAGTIWLQVGETFRSQRGAVITTTTGAGGGAIVLNAGRLVQLRDSALATSVPSGVRDAGNLTLTAPFVVAEGSAIIANAFGGRGGQYPNQFRGVLERPGESGECFLRDGDPGHGGHPGPRDYPQRHPGPPASSICGCGGAAARPVCGAGPRRALQQPGLGRARRPPGRPWRLVA
jgi:filamentous hemagglutinin family protein